jgi:hypothetical protein
LPPLGASLGKFLRRRNTIEITNDDDSELLRKLKEWKKHKREYLSQMAENLAVDEQDKDKIKSMIVKLMTIETQIKEINVVRQRKDTKVMDRRESVMSMNSGGLRSNMNRGNSIKHHRESDSSKKTRMWYKGNPDTDSQL